MWRRSAGGKNKECILEKEKYLLYFININKKGAKLVDNTKK